MIKNGFDRLVLASEFPKIENPKFGCARRSFSFSASKLKNIVEQQVQRNPDCFLKNLCNVNTKNDQTLDIKITDEKLIDIVSKDIDLQGRKLLSFLDSPKTPLDISYALKVPTTSLYRKINQLNQDGFITQVGTKKTKNSKSNLYVKTFDRIIFEVGRQNSVIITVKQSVLQNSITYSTISK